VSRKWLLFLFVFAVHASLGQDVDQSVNLTMRRAADQIDHAQISRADAVKITATFIETQAARNALKKSLGDYVHSMNDLDKANASKLTRLLTVSEGQLRIMHSANILSNALDQIEALSNAFSLIAPDAAQLATNYAAAQKAPVADEARRVKLTPPTKEQAVELLNRMQANDSAFNTAYRAFCGQMESKFGFAFIAEATQAALEHA
jgi:hypothetical protein